MTVIPLCFDRKKSDNFEKSQMVTGGSTNDMVVTLMEFRADFPTGIQIEIFEVRFPHISDGHSSQDLKITKK